MTAPEPSSPRLIFRLLELADLAVFHELALDAHVRRYLLDGQAMSQAWCVERTGRP